MFAPEKQIPASLVLNHGSSCVIMHSAFYVASEISPVSGSTPSTHEIGLLFMSATSKEKLFLSVAQHNFNAIFIGRRS